MWDKSEPTQTDYKNSFDQEDIALMDLMNLSPNEFLQLDAFCDAEPVFTGRNALMSEWIRLKTLLWQKRTAGNDMMYKALNHQLDQALLSHGNEMVRWEINGEDTERIES